MNSHNNIFNQTQYTMEQNNTPVNFDDFVSGYSKIGKSTVTEAGIKPNDAGWFYANEDDAETEVLTLNLPNREQQKKISLTTGSEVIARQLKGKDSQEAMRMAGMGKKGATSDNYLPAMISLACTVDGNAQAIEFYNELPMKDFNRIMAIVTSLNF